MPSHESFINTLKLCLLSRKMPSIFKLLIFLSTTFLVFIPSQGKKGKICSFDRSWEGKWFEYGEREGVYIGKSNITHKGKCLQKDGVKYIFQDETKGCLRCAVMHQKHSNVIQYKESHCEAGYDNYPLKLCYKIKTDEPLKSLFRLDAQPVPCPIRGSFQFEYSRGHGLCDYPKSSISQCSDKSKLIFRYQACADIKGSESSVEQLKCLADWKEGSTYYFLGLMNNSHVKSEDYEERFRCFVYQSIHKGFFLSQSGEAKCNLYTAREGARTMKLKRVHNHQQQCEIPEWVFNKHHQFQDLNYSTTYHFNQKGSSLTIADKRERTRKLKCNTVDFDTGNKTRIIMQVNFECENGYMCMELERKDTSVLWLRIGRLSRNPEEACHQQLFFDSTVKPTILIGSSHENDRCPLVGKYRPLDSKMSCSYRDDYVISGCSGASSLEIIDKCGDKDESKSYTCHGSWTEETEVSPEYLPKKTYFVVSPIARSSESPKRLCALLLGGRNATHDGVKLLATSNRCPEESEETDRFWDFSLERTSHCAQALATANTNSGHRKDPSVLLIFFIAIFVFRFSSFP